jgi:F0F1-type ATP synthase beta subunit
VGKAGRNVSRDESRRRLPRMVMAFGQMNETPGSRFSVGHIARSLRDEAHRDVRDAARGLKTCSGAFRYPS